MIFDVYGRYLLEIFREGERWRIYRLSPDRNARLPFADFAIPSDYGPEEIARYLDDMLHESARPGHEIRRLDSSHEKDRRGGQATPPGRTP